MAITKDYFVSFKYGLEVEADDNSYSTVFATGLIYKQTEYPDSNVSDVLLCLPKHLEWLKLNSEGWAFDDERQLVQSESFSSSGSFFCKIQDLSDRYSLYRTRLKRNKQEKKLLTFSKTGSKTDYPMEAAVYYFSVNNENPEFKIERVKQQYTQQPLYTFSDSDNKDIIHSAGAPVFDNSGVWVGWIEIPNVQTADLQILSAWNLDNKLKEYFYSLIADCMRKFVLLDSLSVYESAPVKYYNFCTILFAAKQDLYNLVHTELLEIKKNLSYIEKEHDRFKFTDLIHFINQDIGNFSKTALEILSTYFRHDDSGNLEEIIVYFKEALIGVPDKETLEIFSPACTSALPRVSGNIQSKQDLREVLAGGDGDAYSISCASMDYLLNYGHGSSAPIIDSIFNDVKAKKLNPGNIKIKYPLPHDRSGFFEVFLYRMIALHAATKY